MTEPVTDKVQVSAYTGVQAGIVRNVSKDSYLNMGAMLGGEVNYKGTFARAEVGAGTATYKSVQIGHTFDIGKNMGLELSAKTQDSSFLLSKGSARVTIENHNMGSMEEAKQSIETSREVAQKSEWGNINAHLSQYMISSEWNIQDKRLGAKAKLTFGSSNAKFGVGVEGGIRTDGRPNVNYELSANHVVEHYVDGKCIHAYDFTHNSSGVLSENKKEGYVTPTVSADVKLNKHLSLNVNADLYQGQAGIRYNF